MRRTAIRHRPQIGTVVLLGLLGIVSPAAEIRVEGLRTMKEGEVLELLGDRLEYIRAKPPSPARAGDAAFLLENLMQRQGFQNPEVTPRVAGNAIHLVVNEGARLSIGSVAVPGFPEEDQVRLSRLFRLPGQERVLNPGQEPPFREADVAEGLSLIEADLRSRGYWKAAAAVERRGIVPGTGQIAFIIRVRPGPLHQLGAPRFDGAPAELLPELQARSAPHVGRIAGTDRLTSLRAGIEGVFRSTGYPLETFKMNRILGEGTLTPRFIIRFGPRQRLGRVHVSGHEKTKAQRVTRRFETLRGDWFDAESFDERLKQLLATGAFSSIRVENSNRPDGSIDATLHLVEGRARGATSYGGFGSYEGAILGVKYHDRNYRGNLWNLGAGFEISARGLLGEVRLSNPWLLDSDTYLGLRLFSVTRGYEGYDKFETGLSAEFSRDGFARHLDASLLLGGSLVNISENGIPATELGETVYTHSFLRASAAYDRRDSAVSPTTGYHVNTLLEGGLVLGDINSSYLRLDSSAAGYLPLGKAGQLNFGARSGLLFPSGGPTDLPIDLRLFTGGPDSVRSFRYRELGPRSSSNDPLGGEAYWVANAEYVRALAGPLKCVGFLDAGDLSALGQGIDFASPELAVGLGIRLDLPVGPIRFEYGHNLTRDGGEPSGTWHFAIGSAF
jgi:outer membrane protein insertion porin family